MLEELHLANNRLTAVPATLLRCNVLNTLDLSDNKLESIPVGGGRDLAITNAPQS